MRPCALCGDCYYCDETCAAVDAPAHALACRNARGRAKWPTKLATFWCQSRATIVARAALRRRPKPSVEAVLREIAVAHSEEAADARAAAAAAPPKVSRADRKAVALNEAAAKADGRPTAAAFAAEVAEGEAARVRLRDANRAEEVRLGKRYDAAAVSGALDDDLRRIEAQALAFAPER